MEKKFRIISIVFIIGCFLFYGGRFVYFHNKYSKKSTSSNNSQTLGITIQKNNGTVSNGDGLYNENGNLVFKGTNVNNYVEYSNIIWRVLKIKEDKSVVLVTDDVVSNLAFSNTNSDFTTSNINEWLNSNGENTGIFENILNQKEKYLNKTPICLDNVVDENNITCKNKNEENYVTMLGLEDYLNSKNDTSYIDNFNDMWLYNKNGNNVWSVLNSELKTSSVNEIHGIKVVISLKNSVKVKSGKGTKENPYIIDNNNELSFNKYVKLGNDLYTVLQTNKNYTKLVLDSLVDNRLSFNTYNTKFDLQNNTLAYYLNNDYYNSLTYKNSLVSCDFYTGNYSSNDYKDIYKTKITSKVGLLSIADINLNNVLNDYYLLNSFDNNYIYSYYYGLYATSFSNKKAFRPVVCIKNDSKLKGKGTKTSPFELEV